MAYKKTCNKNKKWHPEMFYKKVVPRKFRKNYRKILVPESLY